MKSFHLEYLPNLQKLYIFYSDTFTTNEIQLSTDQLKLDSLVFNLPFLIDELTITRAKSVISARIQSETLYKSLLTDAECFIQASELVPETRLYCTQCQLPLTSSLKKIQNCPSDYWHELLDCWACHNENYSHIKGHTGGLVYAKKESLLVGSYFVIVHPDQVDSQVLQTIESVSPYFIFLYFDRKGKDRKPLAF
jgi:hypothetical protein